MIIWRKKKEREEKRDDSPSYVHARLLSRVLLFATPRTVACQAPLSMRFSRQEYWSGLPFPPPRDLPHSGIEHTFSMAPVLAEGFFTTEIRGKPPSTVPQTKLYPWEYGFTILRL